MERRKTNSLQMTRFVLGFTAKRFDAYYIYMCPRRLMLKALPLWKTLSKTAYYLKFLSYPVSMFIW